MLYASSRLLSGEEVVPEITGSVQSSMLQREARMRKAAYQTNIYLAFRKVLPSDDEQQLSRASDLEFTAQLRTRFETPQVLRFALREGNGSESYKIQHRALIEVCRLFVQFRREKSIYVYESREYGYWEDSWNCSST